MNSRLPSSTANGMPDSGLSAGALYRELAASLRASGTPTPELDARLIVCYALGISHETLVAEPERRTSLPARQTAFSYAKRRCAHEPVSRIVGVREFRGLDFKITPDTLDPRPDTETVIDASLEVLGSAPRPEGHRILDIGTGSGCILVSLLHEVGSATGVGTDISERALCVARDNASRHGVTQRARFVCTSWSTGVAGSHDLVVSNPPYIATGAIADLAPDVYAYDPRSALDGGSDGLDAYRDIIPALRECLVPGGWVVLEVGAGQAEAVCNMLATTAKAVGFEKPCHWRDLAGHVRCIGARRSPSA